MQVDQKSRAMQQVLRKPVQTGQWTVIEVHVKINNFIYRRNSLPVHYAVKLNATTYDVYDTVQSDTP